MLSSHKQHKKPTCQKYKKQTYLIKYPIIFLLFDRSNLVPIVRKLVAVIVFGVGVVMGVFLGVSCVVGRRIFLQQTHLVIICFVLAVVFCFA